MYRRFLILLAAVVFAASCESEVREANINQEKAIDDYVKQNYADAPVEYVEGITRVLLQDVSNASSPAAAKNDSLYIYYAGYTFENGAPSSCFVQDSAWVRLGRSGLVKGLERGLDGVKQYQEVLLLFSSQYGYGTDAVGLVPANTALAFDVAVARVIKNN